jgi:hypothetical protein
MIMSDHVHWSKHGRWNTSKHVETRWNSNCNETATSPTRGLLCVGLRWLEPLWAVDGPWCWRPWNMGSTSTDAWQVKGSNVFFKRVFQVLWPQNHSDSSDSGDSEWCRIVDPRILHSYLCFVIALWMFIDQRILSLWKMRPSTLGFRF